MSHDELLQNLRELLEANSGINVTEAKGNQEYLEIEFTVADAFSRLVIHSLAEASNSLLSVCSKFDPCSEDAQKNPEECLIYAFRSDSNHNVIDEFSRLAAHLAWIMYRCGLITAEEEKECCKLFGAACRST
ncbi:MAG: hypothetical protein AB2700_13860 [Candidatus Thiodiazotropha taylori]